MTALQQNNLPTEIIIFGASGDLTHRKLIPSLFNLFRKERVSNQVQIMGFATRPWNDATFREEMKNGLDVFSSFDYQNEEWQAFSRKLFYHSGNFIEPDDYVKLAERIGLDKPVNRLIYLAAPPKFYVPILENLSAAGLLKETDHWVRVVIEKPFGHNLESAKSLNQSVHQVLKEEQIYRIDHYLGKETVQNILVFRFANTIFEPIWNRNYIDHVQISVAESVGVGHRAKYYDGVGVLRDMFQNHLFQLLSLVAMEPPASFSAEALRNERVKVLSAVRPITRQEAAEWSVRGQYDQFEIAGSQTPTYAAVKMFVENWRWQGVPFYLRSGKKMPAKSSEIIVQFKCPPHVMFPMQTCDSLSPNRLTICLQPNEGIHFQFEAKQPDTSASMKSVHMEFDYAEAFGVSAIPEAYERLLLDAMNGDASLFSRADAIELAWQLVDPILESWEMDQQPPLAIYDQHSWGPKEADEFLEKDGREWYHECGMEHNHKMRLVTPW
ncbi:MAG: glucose-6-phosphate dehydrogenase [Anaerolineaceae bacterium]|nr:glucose-6-phosphate dehydrogenase [Anaerolineaceae bacterium]